MSEDFLEIRWVQELKDLPKGKLVKIAGQHSNGVDFSVEGRVYKPFNGTIKLISHDKDAQQIQIDWMSFDTSKKNIVVNDYRGNIYPKSHDPENYQTLSQEMEVAI